MPFDGIVTKCIVDELSEKLRSGRVEKIFQPEADEIRINIRAQGNNYKLLASASPNNPRLHLTDTNKENPALPPVFCMLLRKHLVGGIIQSVDFHDFERIITINLECITELGDTVIRRLIIEIMGKYSNIILTTEDGIIIDAIKHVDNEMSRVREVMPARHYVLPPPQDKVSPLALNIDALFINIGKESLSLDKFLLNNIKGFSPLLCKEICLRAEIDPKTKADVLTYDQTLHFKKSLSEVIDEIKVNSYSPVTIYEDESCYVPVDFHCIKLQSTPFTKMFTSISLALDEYFLNRDKIERSRQKKAHVEKALSNCLERCYKKLAIREETLRGVEARDTLRLYGELITANIYSIEKGAESANVLNYYSINESGESDYIDIPLRTNLTPQDNAQRYYKKYAKAKSTFEQTTKQIAENLDEIKYLESVAQMLDNAATVQDIDDIRQELTDEGYIKGSRVIKGKGGHGGKKKAAKASAPLTFKSSDGFQIYVGRNNKQNDILTLKTAFANDLWFHTKSFPGSHVIVRVEGREVSEMAMAEAAMIAAFFSKARSSYGVNVDYTKVRYVKKPAGAKPGMVIYTDYRTILVTPDERKVESLKV